MGRPGKPAAPKGTYLPLLPSGPDGVHKALLHRARPPHYLHFVKEILHFPSGRVLEEMGPLLYVALNLKLIQPFNRARK